MFDADLLYKEFRLVGAVTMVAPDGRHLVIARGSNVGKMSPPCVFIAFEGEGAFFWDGTRPLNKFQLAKAGFEFTIADTLANMLNRVFGLDRPQGNHATLEIAHCAS